MLPTTMYEGTGGTVEVQGRVIGSVGAWSVRLYGDSSPYFRATGCRVPALWRSVGLTSLVCRLTRAGKPFTIEGRVAVLTADAISLGQLIIEEAA